MVEPHTVQGLAPTSQSKEPPSVSAHEGGSVDPVGQRGQLQKNASVTAPGSVQSMLLLPP